MRTRTITALLIVGLLVSFVGVALPETTTTAVEKCTIGPTGTDCPENKTYTEDVPVENEMKTPITVGGMLVTLVAGTLWVGERTE